MIKSLKKAIIIPILAAIAWLSPASATCQAKAFEIMTIIGDLCYECIYPLKIAGIPVMRGPLNNEPTLSNASKMPICMCPFPPPIFQRIGIPISFFEMQRLAEVVHDPWCSPVFGFELKSSTNGTLAGTEGASTSTVGKGSGKTFAQVHWWIFSVFNILEWVVDGICVEHSDIDIAAITEVDPLWQEDQLSAFLYPDAILYGNPVVNLACIADSIAASVTKYPLEVLFWCKGSWGNAFPLTGNTLTNGTAEDGASILSTFIFMGHRTTLIWNEFGPGIMMCAKWPSPIWFKNAYRIQPVLPVPHPMALVVGETSITWGAGKNPPYQGDNFGYVVFKKRECCAW